MPNSEREGSKGAIACWFWKSLWLVWKLNGSIYMFLWKKTCVRSYPFLLKSVDVASFLFEVNTPVFYGTITKTSHSHKPFLLNVAGFSLQNKEILSHRDAKDPNEEQDRGNSAASMAKGRCFGWFYVSQKPPKSIPLGLLWGAGSFCLKVFVSWKLANLQGPETSQSF